MCTTPGIYKLPPSCRHLESSSTTRLACPTPSTFRSPSPCSPSTPGLVRWELRDHCQSYELHPMVTASLQFELASEPSFHKELLKPWLVGWIADDDDPLEIFWCNIEQQNVLCCVCVFFLSFCSLFQLNGRFWFGDTLCGEKFSKELKNVEDPRQFYNEVSSTKSKIKVSVFLCLWSLRWQRTMRK